MAWSSAVRRAVVLGGGGARGPYQIGVWQAMNELGLDYHIVTGTSVGALNGALMVQREFDKAKELWLQLTLNRVVAGLPEWDEPAPTDRSQTIFLLRKLLESGGLDISPLESIVRQVVDETVIRASLIEYGLVAAQFPTLKPVQLLKEEIPNGELVDYMLASASWFPFFTKRNIDGTEYIDGAYSDNLPAQLALRCGPQELVAIDLQGTGIVHAYQEEIPTVYIRSHWNLGDMMAFDTQAAARNIRLGYQDGMKAWHALEGNAYAFYPGSSRRNAYRVREAIDRIRQRTGVSLFKDYHRLPKVQEMLRYRNSDRRFMRTGESRCTLGHAIITAAEIAGELLQIPPDKIYTIHQFNDLLLEQIPRLRPHFPNEKEGNLFYAEELSPAARGKRSHIALRRLYRTLEDGYISGGVHDSFWRLSALFPVEFVAANYLLALHLSK